MSGHRAPRGPRVDGVSLRVRRRRVRFTPRRQPGGSVRSTVSPQRRVRTPSGLRTQTGVVRACGVRATDPKPVRRGAPSAVRAATLRVSQQAEVRVDGDENRRRRASRGVRVGDGAVRPGGPGGGSEGREGHVRRATAATRDGGAQGCVSVPEGALQTLRGENLAAAAGRARVEVRGENRRVFQMRREGAEGRDANARRERMPGRGGTVRVRGVRVRAQGATGGVPSALEGVLPRTPAPRPRQR